GGDGQQGPRTAVEAIRAGKIAAASIDTWLRGTTMNAEIGKAIKRADVTPLVVDAHDRTYRRRASMPEKSVEEVLGNGNYVRIEEGLTDEMAQGEVRRCLRCDTCIGCGLCMVACSEMGIEALRMGETKAGRLAYFDFTRAADLCIGCGACTQVCPTGAIRIEDMDDLRRTIITGTVVCEQPLVIYKEPGIPAQTPAHRNYIRQRLPAHMAAHLDREISPLSARQRGDRPEITPPHAVQGNAG
ncbi:MAG TPA: 4Fe-4S dicluster domain-containing protein, partial [Rhodocyclaceae bacterium]|nr:4Fe-4S dicluster domain-containing protein [Rhodocyclaceae bacterium]